MSTDTLYAVIMAGGNGTRLWPASRQLSPKQFMVLNGGQSMLQATAARLAPLVNAAHTWVITGAEHAKSAGYAELKNFPHLIEPTARNTAPAIAIMAAYMADFHTSPLMLILPADHVIKDVPAFHAAIAKAINAAEQNQIVTFGIQPTHAETGFGYIKVKAARSPALPVEEFIEKPNLENARRFLDEGNYYWNSGMFLARTDTMLKAIEEYLPDVWQILTRIRNEWNAENYQTVVSKHFADMPKVSIDYGVMEKADNVVVVPCSIGWSDVGSWEAVYQLAEKDAEGNVHQAPVINIGGRNNLVSGARRLIATIGVEDLCIVDTPDALLITRRDQSQKVKEVVDEVKKLGGQQHFTHITEKRPWGSFTVLEDEGRGYKIKRIEVTPRGRLSLQSHQHRSEHWVVVSGTATVTRGTVVETLRPNQGTYIPVGEKHRLENLGNEPVQMIEVQVGSYVGEDDIVRYDDVYGR